jgi:uncharacterized protein (DUF1697 family)
MAGGDSVTGKMAGGNLRYVAFLRGINVGGNKQIKMEDLRKAFESMGFEDVATVLNSGNVLFRAKKTADANLEQRIRDGLVEILDKKTDILVRTGVEIEALVASDPFRQIETTPQTRLYVTFFSGEVRSSLKLPYESAEGDIRILSVSSGAVCTAIELSPKKGTVDLMKVIEIEFGSGVTTRNWSTILKIHKKLAEMEGGA